MTQAEINPPTRLVIGLLWHSITSDNLGVGALTESQIAICQAAAVRAGVSLEFIIFGTQGGCSYPPAGVTLSLGSRISIKQILRGKSPFLDEIERCDLVLDIGEGDSFADIYGIKRFLFLIVSKIAVLIKGKPLILSPQTIGPFDRGWTRAIAAWVMTRCVRVYARDGLSADYLRSMGMRANVDEAIDVAFRLPFKRFVMEETGRTRIGLNVSGLLFSGGYEGSNQFGLSLDYPTLMRRLLKAWTADPGKEVWLIPHVIPDGLPRDDDRVAIQVLQTEFPVCKVTPRFESPGVAKSFIAAMDFVTGARMHACIAAFSAGVPVVPLAYSRKFNGLFNSLGFDAVADGKTMNTEEAEAFIQKRLVERTTMLPSLSAGNERAQTKLAGYEEFLCAMFQRLRIRGVE